MTGQVLRQARTNLGPSQVEAAAQLGVSQPLLSLIEKGERVSQKLTRFAKSRGHRVSASLRTSSDPLSRLTGNWTHD